MLLSGGLLEGASGTRTVRDWIVDVAIVLVAFGSGLFVLSSTWDAHSNAVKVLDIVLGSVACVALFARRRHPLGVALLIVPLSAISALAAMATLPAVLNAAIRVSLKALAAIVALAVAGTAIDPQRPRRRAGERGGLADVVEDDGGASGFEHTASLGSLAPRSHCPRATPAPTKVALARLPRR